MTTPHSFHLRPFQEQVFKTIMRGKSVILQAPTGSGKTKAALSPFVQNLAVGEHQLPHTCRYAVPLRVLANQFYREFCTLAEDIDRQAPTRLTDIYQNIGRGAIAIQTGEQPDDPQFESLLTFCTIDQLLASFLAVPYGLGSRLANINVGAVAGSYLALDEFHLYPLREHSIYGARTTTIHMLRLLRDITPFVMMTATFSTTLLERLQTLLGAEIVSVRDQQELLEIAQGRTRTFKRSAEAMDARAIFEEHRSRQRAGNACTLVVCNTVLRAQKLFLEMKAVAGEHTRVVLLHSRFSAADRRTLSGEIEQELGPQQWQDGIYLGRDIIVIATQVVEVGLDISVQVLHTENAPANSLIQRAGRCARFAHQHGVVFVYPLPLDAEGNEASTLPYENNVCAATWGALTGLDGREVGFLQEQELIDEVHTLEDRALLDHYERNEEEITGRIFQCFNTNDRSETTTLIREVSQVHILIHDTPDETITEEPWRWQTFAFHPGSFASSRRWQELQERGRDLEWVCKKAEPDPTATSSDDPKNDDTSDNRQKTRYMWQSVTNPHEAAQALIIALPRQLARYDSELGFVLLDGQLNIGPGTYQSALLPATSRTRDYAGSHVTSYQDHIRGLVCAYDLGIKDALHFFACKLEDQMGLSHGIVDQAIRLAIACHDLGKLNRSWQQWALAWQKLLYEKQGRTVPYQPPDPSFCFAKTDFNFASREQRQWQKEVHLPRPHHACESVFLGRTLIGVSLGISKTSGEEQKAVWRAICGAIARHHSSQASAYSIAALDEKAQRAAEEALQIAHQGGSWSYDPARLETHIKRAGDLAPTSSEQWKITRPDWTSGRIGELETWLYFVIVRALRLADQRAG